MALSQIVLFDAIDLSQIPAGPSAVGAYVDGRWATAAAAAARFPHARILTIATSAAHDAEALDVETGDATPGDVPAWYKRQQPKVQRPCLYASVDLMQAELIPVLKAAGIPRSSVRLWSAHYAGKHICAPSTCGELGIEADGTQWTDRAFGRDLDQSLLAAGFFGTIPALAPPAPEPVSGPVPAWQEELMNALPALQGGSQDHPGGVQFVRRVQALVACIGTANSLGAVTELKQDGNFGAATEAGVKRIQEFFGIAQDGIVGPGTWAVLIGG